jgi:glycine/D-amino acid oxidase-like deaminating enzyme
MVPEEAAPLGLKIAHHFPGRPTDPDTVSRALEPGDADTLTREIATLLPGVRTRPLSHRVCLYSNSPDHHFLVDRHPSHPTVFLAGGFSGHGFKFAPVIGEILADLALSGNTPHPVGFLGLQRLGL